MLSRGFISDESKRKCAGFLNGMKQISMVNRISIEESLHTVKFSI
jgi:hypothetical protein